MGKRLAHEFRIRQCLFLFTAAVTPNAAVATNAITGPVGMLAWNERYMPTTAEITPTSAPIIMTSTNRLASRNPVAAGVMSIAMTKTMPAAWDADDDDEGKEGEQHVFHQACPDPCNLRAHRIECGVDELPVEDVQPCYHQRRQPERQVELSRVDA